MKKYVVVDTNVLVSALITRNESSPTVKILRYISENKIIPVYSEEIIKEYNEELQVIDKIMKNQSVDEFCKIVSKDPKADSAVIEYLKKNYPSELETYLKYKGNYEELFFQAVEKYFKSNSLDDKKRSLRDAKESLDKIALIKGTPFDVKFYRNYLKEIENSIYTKTEFIKENIILQTDTSPFDCSLYDTFKTAIKKEKFGKVEQKIKMFDISKRKINILRIRTYAEMDSIEGVDAMYNKGDFKKYDLSLPFRQVCLRSESRF